MKPSTLQRIRAGAATAPMLRLAAVVVALFAPLATAEPRIALVIGNGAYASSPLTNPASDAQLMSRTLTGLGFEVIERRDGDQATMKRAIQDFGLKLERAGPTAVGLFFYAGHGVQLNGRNYLIPTRARIERDSDLEIEAVSADWVLEQMRYARNRLNLVILDACRNNPFVRSFRSADRGLARMDAPAGVLIAYSTAPGDVAADGNSRNSPYTEALARVMREPGQPVEQVFKRTRIAVLGATDGRQTPWESSSLTGDFYFLGGAAPSAASTPPAASVSAPAATTPPRRSAPSGSSPAAPTASVSTPRRPQQSIDVCSLPVGRWRTRGNNIDVPGEVAIEADRTVAWWKNASDRLPAVSGTWSCDAAARRFVFTWGHGSIDTLTLSDDGQTLRGSNQLGIQILQSRLR